jgi:hypothetical protein
MVTHMKGWRSPNPTNQHILFIKNINVIAIFRHIFSLTRKQCYFHLITKKIDTQSHDVRNIVQTNKCPKVYPTLKILCLRICAIAEVFQVHCCAVCHLQKHLAYNFLTWRISWCENYWKKIVFHQIQCYFTVNKLTTEFQHAYREEHSTSTYTNYWWLAEWNL